MQPVLLCLPVIASNMIIKTNASKIICSYRWIVWIVFAAVLVRFPIILCTWYIFASIFYPPDFKFTAPTSTAVLFDTSSVIVHLSELSHKKVGTSMS